jgi:hypothetical protein
MALGRGLGGAHDEQRVERIGQHLEHRPEGTAQPHLDGPRVDRLERLDVADQRGTARLARGPAPQRRHHVLGLDRRTVVELQAFAQHEAPFQPVGRSLVAGDHLRLRPALGVQREELVVDHEAMLDRHALGRHDRIDIGDVAVDQHPQHGLRRGGGRGRGAERGEGRRREHAAQERQSGHAFSPLEPLLAGHRRREGAGRTSGSDRC